MIRLERSQLPPGSKNAEAFDTQSLGLRRCVYRMLIFLGKGKKNEKISF